MGSENKESKIAEASDAADISNITSTSISTTSISTSISADRAKATNETTDVSTAIKTSATTGSDSIPPPESSGSAKVDPDQERKNVPPPTNKMKRSYTCPLPSSPSLHLAPNKSGNVPAMTTVPVTLAASAASAATTGTGISTGTSSKNNKTLSRSHSDRGVAYQGQGQGIDAHPYARGSVIEVLYGVAPKTKTSHGTNTETDDENDEDDEEEEDEEDEDEEFQEGIQTKLDRDPSQNQNQTEIRLADIIDRAPSKTPEHAIPCLRWKYYIHYREYNRRMDEWITDPARIISPPSVGNAKVRALKKAKAAKQEEERRTREREKRAREQKSVLADIQGKRRKTGDGTGSGAGDGIEGDEYVSGDGAGNSNSPLGRPVSQRASSRRASKAIAASSSQSNIVALQFQSDDGGSGSGNQIMKDAALDEQERLRLTRSQRRKSTRGAGVGGDDPEESGKKKHGHGASDTGSGMVVTTLLPDDKMIQDKVVTVAAQELDEHEGLDEASLREHEEVTKVKNVNEVELGRYRMDTWYFSPLPKELLKDGNMVEVLHVCEFTLQFFTRKEELVRFQRKQLPKNKRHPPGNEIYRNGNLSMFEIDGFEERIYCQNLCYIAKLFLDHKTLYFDVDPFLFYVLCEVDERGFHPVGYYSKEKYSDVGYNLACILTLPCHQRKGYGRFLIDFSYELSKKEEKVGSPEKPMSDLGQQAYKPYWTSTILDFLLNRSDEKSMSIMDISKRTSIMAEDIIFTLNMLGLLKYINGVYFITAERTLLQELAKKHPVKEPRVDPSKLHWTPYLTDVKRDKFSIHSKKPSVEGEAHREKGGF